MNEVARFYDDFMKSRMVSYRIDGNLRIDAATALAKMFIRPASRIVDIGCGIGILSEALGKADSANTVLGIDLSQGNIEYAKRTIDLPNVKFQVVDVTDQFNFLRQQAGNKFDAAILIDVIEHIPASERVGLLRDIYSICDSGGLLLMTYPSPEYQKHLIANNPSELQIIDNVIETALIILEAAKAGWDVKYFRKVDIWQANQYCHLVLQKTTPTDRIDRARPSLSQRLFNRFDKIFKRPKRVKKYVQDPFINWLTESRIK